MSLPNQPSARFHDHGLASRIAQRALSSPAVLFLGALGLLLAHLTGRLPLSEFGGYDAQFYYRMASTVGLDQVPAPFAYRWLPHELIPYLRLEPKRVYEIVTILAFVVASLGLRRFLIVRGSTPTVATALVVLGFLWARWGARFYCWYRVGTDPMAYALIVWGLVYAERKNILGLCTIGMVGAMCREYTILLFPYYMVRHGLRSKTDLLTGVLVALPCIAVFALVRMLSPGTGDYSLLIAASQSLATKFGSLGELARLLACILTHLGLTTVLLMMFPRTTFRLLLHNPEIALWVGATLAIGLIGGTDTDRLMFYAFPGELVLLSRLLSEKRLLTSQYYPFLAIAAVGQIAISETFSERLTPANIAGLWNLAWVAVWSMALATTFLACKSRVSNS